MSVQVYVGFSASPSHPLYLIFISFLLSLRSGLDEVRVLKMGPLAEAVVLRLRPFSPLMSLSFNFLDLSSLTWLSAFPACFCDMSSFRLAGRFCTDWSLLLPFLRRTHILLTFLGHRQRFCRSFAHPCSPSPHLFESFLNATPPPAHPFPLLGIPPTPQCSPRLLLLKISFALFHSPTIPIQDSKEPSSNTPAIPY